MLHCSSRTNTGIRKLGKVWWSTYSLTVALPEGVRQVKVTVVESFLRLRRLKNVKLTWLRTISFVSGEKWSVLYRVQKAWIFERNLEELPARLTSNSLAVILKNYRLSLINWRPNSVPIQTFSISKTACLMARKNCSCAYYQPLKPSESGWITWHVRYERAFLELPFNAFSVVVMKWMSSYAIRSKNERPSPPFKIWRSERQQVWPFLLPKLQAWNLAEPRQRSRVLIGTERWTLRQMLISNRPTWRPSRVIWRFSSRKRPASILTSSILLKEKHENKETPSILWFLG